VLLFFSGSLPSRLLEQLLPVSMENTTNHGPVMSPSKHDEKDLDSDVSGTPPIRIEDVERIGTSTMVDAETEKRLLRKLDIRIIPMICWIYLMNFMDRGMSPGL
jgi:hypothetical protein